MFDRVFASPAANQEAPYKLMIDSARRTAASLLKMGGAPRCIATRYERFAHTFLSSICRAVSQAHSAAVSTCGKR